MDKASSNGSRIAHANDAPLHGIHKRYRACTATVPPLKYFVPSGVATCAFPGIFGFPHHWEEINLGKHIPFHTRIPVKFLCFSASCRSAVFHAYNFLCSCSAKVSPKVTPRSRTREGPHKTDKVRQTVSLIQLGQRGLDCEQRDTISFVRRPAFDLGLFCCLWQCCHASLKERQCLRHALHAKKLICIGKKCLRISVKW